MTAPHFPALPSGAGFHAEPFDQIESWMPIQIKKESGVSEVRARWDAQVRSFRLSGVNLTQRDIDVIMGFFRDRKGGSNFFYWDNNLVVIWSPSDAPTTDENAGGSIAGPRTRYVAYTWSDGSSKETEDSLEATQIIAANNLLEVTIPAFPAGVTQANIYAGSVSGTLKYVSKITATRGTWNEFYSTVDADSADGQKVLNVAATTGFLADDNVIIGEGTAREEIGVIDTVQAGISITLLSNLTFAHTLAQADPVSHSLGGGATAPPSSNNFTGEEIKVHLLNDPVVVPQGPDAYNLMLEIEEEV